MIEKIAFTAGYIIEALTGEHPIWEPKAAKLSRQRLGQLEPQLEALKAELTESHNSANARAQELKEVWNLAEDQDCRIRKLERELRDATREKESLLLRNGALEAENARMLRVKFTTTSYEHVIPVPQTLDELGTWTERHFSGRLQMTRRALHAANHSMYKDVPTIYRSLILIGGEYYDMLFNRSPDSVKAFERQSTALKVEIAPVWGWNPSVAPGDYYVNGRLMDHHLKKGANSEQRHTLRIYFFSDQEKRQIVIGHLPNHLSTLHM